MSLFDSILERIASYPALYIACAFSGLGIPMPEDVPLLVAGLQLADGRFEWGPTILAAVLGVLTRDTLAWLIGRLVGQRLLDSPRFRAVVPSAKLDRAREMLAERGPVAVLAGRFMVGFRVPMFLAAGTAGVPLRAFLAWDILGMVVAVPGLIALGYAFGPPVLAVAVSLVPRIRELLVVFILLGAAWLFYKRAAADDG